MTSNARPGVEPVAEPVNKRNERGIAAALILTYLTLVAIVGLMWLSALQSSGDGVTTSSGARAAIVALSACFVVAVFVRSATLWTPRWLPWVAVMTTAAFVAAAALLFLSGNLDRAFALYGGFQVPRAGRLFSDTHGLLSWYSCGYCEEWEALYGTGMKVLYVLSGGQIGLPWLPFLGLLLTVMALLTAYVLVSSSSSLGRWVVVIAAVSPAWLLLVERANWDVLVLGTVVIGGIVVARRPSYVSWSIFAAAIWFLGTIKIYPFAFGLVLLMALSLRWGWVVIVGFLSATAAFVVVYFDSLQQSGGLHSSPELLAYEPGASPAYGWSLLSERLDGLLSQATANWVTLGLLGIVLMSASWWGWLVGVPGDRQQVRVRLGILSLAGSTAFMAKALVVGFGFAYTGAALLLVVPTISIQSGRPSVRNGSMVVLALLVLVAVFGMYNLVLGTLAGFIVAGFGLGFGARVAWEAVESRLHDCLRKIAGPA